jgi:hypothetical protein
MAQGFRSSGLLDGTLSWLDQNLDSFDPFRGEQEPAVFAELPIVELSLVCMCLRRQSATAGGAVVDRFLDFITDTYSKQAFRHRLFRRPQEFTSHAFLTAALRISGVIDASNDVADLQSIVDRGALNAISRPPHRMLELRYALELNHLSHRLPSTAQIVRHTVLSEPVKVTYLTQAEAYVITHVLFYVSDLGAQAASGLPESYLRNARAAAKQLLGMYLWSRDWDLTGEFLLSLRCLREPESPLSEVAQRLFAAAQGDSGAVPGRYYDPNEERGRSRTERQKYRFQRCYHTTIVAALVAILCPPSTRDGAVVSS